MRADIAVHPRVCGEQETAAIAQDIVTRFIPACAGNRAIARRTIASAAVHPRVCGEQGNDLVNGLEIDGSSPRVRGTDGPRTVPACSLRFIPACAGNRRSESGTGGVVSVHPRVCGEQTICVNPTGDSDGSSPRVRGTAMDVIRSLELIRFIPACAGNRTIQRLILRATAVHPRVCGEQVFFLSERDFVVGSSPRVRGTGINADHGRCVSRFIPACAGNRCRYQLNHHTRPVHPRVCGEQPVCKLLIWLTKSPFRKATSFFYGFPPFPKGANCTSFNPSKSLGMRRFWPMVKKS